MSTKKINNALISVYHKDKLEQILEILGRNKVSLFSTGGTYDFIRKCGFDATPVEDITGYPSILGGRVKTLHPKIFGGILARTSVNQDARELKQYEIPLFDLVIVDLYPFEDTVASGAGHEDIIEKIDIGGISLIRAAAKNYNDVLVVSSRNQYEDLIKLLLEKNCSSDLADRRFYASMAFHVSSHYDTHIFNYFNREQNIPSLKISEMESRSLRYGENPHQKGRFFGKLDQTFNQLNGKELSYNNLVDIDAAVSLVQEFTNEPAFVIIKHTNACGAATAGSVKEAYLKAFEADTVSAFGGVLATNRTVSTDAAEEINKLFFEVLIAPAYDHKALELLKSRKNRIILQQVNPISDEIQVKSLLNGYLMQDRDLKTDEPSDLRNVTVRQATNQEIDALLFASKICKHTKSNTIVLAKKGQLLASGVGQTSRVDALRQAIEKAANFKMDLNGAVMASDAFFPFPDCVEIADKAGVKAVLQPGGSVKDQESVDYCNRQGMAMVFTGYRHFKH